MRAYIPATPGELAGDVPPVRPAVAAILPDGASPDQVELLEDDAVTEAWLISLELLVSDDAEEGPTDDLRRVVLAVDLDGAAAAPIPDSPRAVLEVQPDPAPGWSDVKAILADDRGAAPAIRRVLDADDDSLDDALDQLADTSLQWFDITERLDLV